MQHVRRRLAHADVPARLATLGRDEFEGYASLFGVADGVGDVVAPGAFAASLRRRGAEQVRMLYQELHCLRLSPCSPEISPSPGTMRTS